MSFLFYPEFHIGAYWWYKFDAQQPPFRGRLLKAVLNLPGVNLTLRFTKPEVSI